MILKIFWIFLFLVNWVYWSVIFIFDFDKIIFILDKRELKNGYFWYMVCNFVKFVLFCLIKCLKVDLILYYFGNIIWFCDYENIYGIVCKFEIFVIVLCVVGWELIFKFDIFLIGFVLKK